MQIKPDVFVGWDWDGYGLTHASEAFDIFPFAVGSFIAPRGMHQAFHCYATMKGVLPLLEGYSEEPFDLPGPDAEMSPDVLMHFGTTMREKRWPIENYLSLARRLEARGYSVGFLESPDDNYGDVIEAPILTRSLMGQALLMRGCKLYIGNDTGPTHLAALVGATTLALFGGSQPRCWRPIGDRTQVLQTCSRLSETDNVFWCRNHECFRGMSVEMVEETAAALLSA